MAVSILNANPYSIARYYEKPPHYKREAEEEFIRRIRAVQTAAISRMDFLKENKIDPLKVIEKIERLIQADPTQEIRLKRKQKSLDFAEGCLKFEESSLCPALDAKNGCLELRDPTLREKESCGLCRYHGVRSDPRAYIIYRKGISLSLTDLNLHAMKEHHNFYYPGNLSEYKPEEQLLLTLQQEISNQKVLWKMSMSFLCTFLES